ncbi:MAG: tetratricopeptide repeat protein [Hyphomicrobiales bacterium]
MLLVAPTVHAQQEMSLKKAVKLAKSGNPQAQVVVGKTFEEGKVVEKNMLAAAQWYKKAMRKGDVEATFRLGRVVHYGGQGVEKSPELSHELYLRASRQDFPQAQYWLGYCYHYGFGTEKDLGKAVEWYRRAAQNNIPQAQNNLAMLHLSGQGVAKNPKLAARFLTRAAKLNYAYAQNNLAGLYELGWGVQKNPNQAIQLYQAAAKAGNPKAIANLRRLGGEDVSLQSPAQPAAQLGDISISGAQSVEQADAPATNNVVEQRPTVLQEGQTRSFNDIKSQVRSRSAPADDSFKN